MTIGTVFLIFRYADLLNQPLESLIRQFQDLQQAGASTIRILDLLALRSALPDTGQRDLPGGTALALHCEDIAFAYSDGDAGEAEHVLSGINFHLPPGALNIVSKAAFDQSAHNKGLE